MQIFSRGLLLNPESEPGLSPTNQPPTEATPNGGATATDSAPEIPPKPASPENDDTAKNGNSGKGGLGEAIRKATAAIGDAGKSIFKKARGRWRKCRACDGQPGNFECPDCKGSGKLPNKNDQPGDEQNPEPEKETVGTGDLSGAGQPSGPGNPEGGNRFRRSVSSSIKSVFAILSAIVAGYADASEIDPEFTDRALEKAMPKDEDIAAFNDDLDAVLKKHNVEPKNSEEWALAINGLKMAAPFAVLIFEFRRELRRKRKEGKRP